MLRNRFLGGVSPLVLFNADGAGGGAAPAPAAAAPAAGSTPAAGSGDNKTPAAAPGAAVPAAGGAQPGAAPAAGATIAGGAEPAAAAAAAKPGGFPDNWRELLAGGDKTLAKDLEKFTDPTKVYASLREMQTKLSKGELKVAPTPLPADATAEQKAEWRKTNGLPETAEAMITSLKLPEGVVVADGDKPLLESFAKAMFDGNATQAEMDRAVEWYYQNQTNMRAQQASGDADFQLQTNQVLAQKWQGAELKTNLNAMGAFLQTLPENLRNSLLSARTEDGHIVGDMPDFIEWAAGAGREYIPTSTIAVPSGASAASTVAAEIEKIEKSMYLPNGSENPEYWRGEGGQKMQERYRELIGIQERMKNQNAAKS